MNRLLVVLVLTFLSYLPAHACTCVRQTRPIAERIAEAKVDNQVIFHGRVITASQELTIISVDKAWTPNISRFVFVSNGFSSCGYDFEAGRDYTIFAYSERGTLEVSMCGLTRAGLPKEYEAALGYGYRPKSYALLWWEIGGTLWLATFVFLKIRRRKQTR